MPTPAKRELGTRLEGPGYDIRQLDAAMFERIEAALLAHGVVVLPGQRLTAAQLHAFGAQFGPPVPPAWGGRPVEFPISKRYVGLLPLTNKTDAATGEPLGAHKFGFGWHTDYGGSVRPSYATMVYALEVPESRGGGQSGATEFTDMCAVWDAIPPGRQQQLLRRKVLYSQTRGYAENNNHPLPGKESYTPDVEWMLAQRPDVEHPLVRRIPQTGRASLHLGDGAAQISFDPAAPGDAGKTAALRRYILELVAAATVPGFVYRHSWAAEDLVLWDNRTLLHQALPYDDVSQTRLVWHLSVKGERPVPANDELMSELLTPPDPVESPAIAAAAGGEARL
eukprot:SAG22_NODE_83_length_21704_cov_58.556584_9_plen_338_part_00